MRYIDAIEQSKVDGIVIFEEYGRNKKTAVLVDGHHLGIYDEVGHVEFTAVQVPDPTTEDVRILGISLQGLAKVSKDFEAAIIYDPGNTISTWTIRIPIEEVVDKLPTNNLEALANSPHNILRSVVRQKLYGVHEDQVQINFSAVRGALT